MNANDIEYYRKLSQALMKAAAASQTLACDCKSSSHGKCVDETKASATLVRALETLSGVLQWQRH